MTEGSNTPHPAPRPPRLTAHLPRPGRTVTVRIEVPRGSFIKRHPDGSIDYFSPLACPFNYGSVVGTTAPDGDPLDAVVLGQRLALGTEVTIPVRAVIGFLDAGRDDPKLICSVRPLSRRDRLLVSGFFRLYAALKGALNRARRHRGATQYRGWLGTSS